MFLFSTTENILFQKFTKMAAVTFFGSSHACRHHWFPQHFLPLFEYSTRLVIQPEDIVGQSGRKMDERAVRDIIQCARKKSPQKHFIVVNLGTNNLRRRDWEKSDFPEDLIGFYKDIAQALESIPNCQLVIPSLIPSFGQDDILKDEYRRFSDHAKALASLKKNVRFYNFSRRLCVNGKLDPSCFSDNVHLSKKGAKIYAESIFNYLENHC